MRAGGIGVGVGVGGGGVGVGGDINRVVGIEREKSQRTMEDGWTDKTDRNLPGFLNNIANKILGNEVNVDFRDNIISFSVGITWVEQIAVSY